MGNGKYMEIQWKLYKYIEIKIKKSIYNTVGGVWNENSAEGNWTWYKNV